MSWVEKYNGFNLSAVSAFTWTEFNLNTLYSVPKNAVVLMALINNEVDSDNQMGVRQNGSSQNRYHNLQEAEGGGQQVFTTFCQTDSDGIIEVWTGDKLNTDIALIGYLTGCTYTEIVATSESVTDDDTWRATGNAAYTNRVVDITLNSVAAANELLIGVRETGSALGRYHRIMEREGAGESILGSMLVQADGSGNFEAWEDSTAGGDDIHANGYFSANVSFTEAHTDENAGTDAAWGNETISAPADSIAHYVITNSRTDNELWGGIRENGSSINRRFNIREAEGGGLNGFGDLVNVDGAQVIENYIQDGTFVDLWYEGYLTITPTWAHKIYGVANANISKIMGVGIADIEKVMGVT